MDNDIQLQLKQQEATLKAKENIAQDPLPMILEEEEEEEEDVNIPSRPVRKARLYSNIWMSKQRSAAKYDDIDEDSPLEKEVNRNVAFGAIMQVLYGTKQEHEFSDYIEGIDEGVDDDEAEALELKIEAFASVNKTMNLVELTKALRFVLEYSKYQEHTREVPKVDAFDSPLTKIVEEFQSLFTERNIE